MSVDDTLLCSFQVSRHVRRLSRQLANHTADPEARGEEGQIRRLRRHRTALVLFPRPSYTHTRPYAHFLIPSTRVPSTDSHDLMHVSIIDRFFFLVVLP